MVQKTFAAFCIFNIVYFLLTGVTLADESDSKPHYRTDPRVVILTDAEQNDSTIESTIMRLYEGAYISSDRGNFPKLLETLEYSHFSCEKSSKSEGAQYFCDYVTPIYLDIEKENVKIAIIFRRQILLTAGEGGISVKVSSGVIAP